MAAPEFLGGSTGSDSIAEEIRLPKLLVGEGKEEVVFFEALLNTLNIRNIQVEQYGGKRRLSAYLETLRVRPNFAQLTSLGVTRDSDDDPVSAVTSVQTALTRNRFTAPTGSGQMSEGNPSVGVMIFPDHGSQGMLEDLCLRSLSADPVLNCLDSYFRCVFDQSANRPIPLAKARIHAWLATQARPDLRLGEAAKRGYLDWSHDAFEELQRFLRDL